MRPHGILAVAKNITNYCLLNVYKIVILTLKVVMFISQLRASKYKTFRSWQAVQFRETDLSAVTVFLRFNKYMHFFSFAAYVFSNGTMWCWWYTKASRKKDKVFRKGVYCLCITEQSTVMEQQQCYIISVFFITHSSFTIGWWLLTYILRSQSNHVKLAAVFVTKMSFWKRM